MCACCLSHSSKFASSFFSSLSHKSVLNLETRKLVHDVQRGVSVSMYHAFGIFMGFQLFFSLSLIITQYILSFFGT